MSPDGYVALAYAVGLALLWTYAAKLWIDRAAWERRWPNPRPRERNHGV